MKSTILEITSGIGILIAIYLFLSKFSATTSIITALGTTSNDMVKTLQGR